MAQRNVGMSGVALLITAAGAWLVYVGVKDVPPVGGLRQLLKGTQPTGSAQALTFTNPGTSSGGGTKVGAFASKLVTVNGIGWGQTPVTIRYLPFGKKLIRATKPGYVSGQRVLDFGSDHRVRSVRVQLSPESPETR